jgi:sulfide:quinone oxidoreductase
VPAAERPRALIAGGGVAALEAAMALRELCGDRLQLTMLSASRHFEYGPLSVAQPFGLGRAHRFRLEDLVGDRGVQLVFDSLQGVEGDHALTRSGREIRFDALLVAVGARKQGALPGALTFSGARTAAELRRLLDEAETGRVKHLCFAVPGGLTWSLPIYELALMTAGHLAERGVTASLSVVSPEGRPVEVFGDGASAAVTEMLSLRGIEYRSAIPVGLADGRLKLASGAPIVADAAVALPRLESPRIDGLPGDERGFIPVDEHGRVAGMSGVFAAGDACSFPLKQGGIAAQQADAAAEAIAAGLGEPLEPRPFRPRLIGLLLTGRAPRHLRLEALRSDGPGTPVEPARWPPVKVAGRRVGPLLARHGAFGGAPPGALAMELEAPDAVVGALSPGAGRGSSDPPPARRR